MKKFILLLCVALVSCKNYDKTITGKYYANGELSFEKSEEGKSDAHLSLSLISLGPEIEFRDDGKVVAMGGVMVFNYERLDDFIYIKTNDGFQVSMKIIDASTLKLEDGGIIYTQTKPKD